MKKLLLLPFFVLCANTMALDIEVFVKEPYKVSGAALASSGGNSVIVYSFDQIDKLEESISERLPNNESQAKVWLERNVDFADPATMRSFVEAYKPHMMTLRYGLTKYPAIVVNAEAVIYGVVDVPQAIGIYKNWKNKNEN